MQTKLKTSIQCPNCKRSISVRVEEMHPGNHKHCFCGAEIKFTGDDGRKIQKSLDDFHKSLKKMFK